MKRSRPTAAFTLVELLVVIAIIVLLAGLSIPAISSSRKKAQSSSCLSNLRQIGVATMAYAADNSMKLPPAGTGGSPEWALSLATYTGVNTKQKKSIFVCPGCEAPVQSGGTGEVAVTYGMHGGLMPKGGESMELGFIPRASDLILCADMCQNPGNKGWSPYSIENPSVFKSAGGRGGSAALDTPISIGPDKDQGNNAWIRYRHNGSANVVMLDGSAKSFKKGAILNGNASITTE